MLQNLTGWHALIVLATLVLLFGATKLPALAKSVGQSMRILKEEVTEEDHQPAQQVQSVGSAPPTVTIPVADPAAGGTAGTSTS
ncbi:twin-arginine translocase TatA/TatE family subunit [Nesterenkonia ebinurensis]|uniref:twin-arginine translocase TatA/TatE family subunit n=1 Tax=Nesterenkonia ebinurensis TaxID=2608252 RepID=UPI00123C8F57|nr:twin-arginine translocase TatA/TatE family subunit [Nesterenkonia ebinurensis]